MNVQHCRQLKTNGTRCQSPAREHADTCRLHKNLHKRRKSRGLSLSAAEAFSAGGGIALHTIEDSASIQRALSVVINAVAAGTLDPARAKVLLYGLQIASANARRLASGSKAEEIAANTAETVNEGETLAAVATDVPERREPEPVFVNECEQEESEDESAETREQDDQPAEVRTETPASPTPSGHVPIPASCFSPTGGYSSGTRDRLLATMQRSESRSVL
jgi:hypothetical protein